MKGVEREEGGKGKRKGRRGGGRGADGERIHVVGKLKKGLVCAMLSVNARNC